LIQTVLKPCERRLAKNTAASSVEQLTIIACGDSPAIRNGLPLASTRYRPLSETFSGYLVSAPLDSDADKTMAHSIARIPKCAVIRLRFAR
jgi:hypothetical protein